MPESAPPIPQALAELQSWPHWVVWRIEQRPDGPTKMPYQAARPSVPAKSTVPDTWSTYEQARKTVERGRCEGVGYVFAPDDEYVGIDFDKCIQPPETAFAAALGQAIHPTVMEIVKKLDSYTEISPSGTGLHVYVRAQFPEGGRKSTGKMPTPWGGKFECYEKERFFTVSGDHLPGTPETINARTDEFVAIHARMFPAAPARANGKGPLLVIPEQTLGDVEIEERIRASKQAADFDRLMRGDTSGHSDDDSSADLALCNILAFWFGPSSARVDSMFRRSGLMREKWDAKRGEQTYGEITIAKALEGRSEFYGARRGTVRRPADDDVEKSPGQEMSEVCGLIDDPFVSGWRSSRQARCRVVLTTRSGRVLDLDSWKTTTSSPPVLAQEIGVQLGVEVTLKKENISRLNVLMGRFCKLVEAVTVADRARELGEAFLQEAEQWPLDMNDQASRWNAFRRLREIHPPTRARAEGISMVAASVVLVDVTGKRFVRVQWFVDYVKAQATSSTVGPILEQIEAPGWWSRPKSEGRFKATNPDDHKPIWQRLFEVPADWESA